MIILGIDPGSTRVGFGVIENTPKGFKPLAHGTIESSGLDSAARFAKTVQELTHLIDLYQPTYAGLEKLFFTKNQKTIMAVSEMRGIIHHHLAVKGLAVHEFTPLQVKQTVCNYGLADKKQVQEMVRVLLGMKTIVKPDDAADALAIAICTAVSIPRG